MSKEKAEMLVGKAMEMVGGGPFQLLPGQVTDDSEMAMHMLKGLMCYDAKKPLKEQINAILLSIANEYVEWLCSNPFDIGLTCKTALMALSSQLDDNES
jgi:ADP-ribosylglycohydrolase